MSKSLHRLRLVLLRALLLAGIVQIAVPSAASNAGPLDQLEAFASSERDDRDGSADVQLRAGQRLAEIDEIDARRHLKADSVVPSLAMSKIFSEESVRIRVEDRRICRPPN